MDAIDDSLIMAHQLIVGVVDPEQNPEGMLIAYGVSSELDEMKRIYFGLPHLLEQATFMEIRRLPLHLQQDASEKWSFVYAPSVGFVLQAQGELLPPDVLECLDDAELLFEGTVCNDGKAGNCYATRLSRELTERYGSIQTQIKDLETAILGRIVQSLRERAFHVRRATAAAAELDCLISLSEVARDFKLQRPMLIDQNHCSSGGLRTDVAEDYIDIRGGRHMLAEMVLPPGAFVPNDAFVGGKNSRIHCITGPNASGKSCYGRQVAIIVFLAHIGSFVPAESATISITDRIMTRVITQETAVLPQSAFMIDLSQVASMIHLATPKTLILIDEFGKGTLPSDGAALVCGLLAHFANLAAAGISPKVILLTHFSEVADQRFLQSCEQIAFLNMAVTTGDVSADFERQSGMHPLDMHHVGECSQPEKAMCRSASQSPEARNFPENPNSSVATVDVTFLYRLIPGHSKTAFGLHCAKMSGVDDLVLQRAWELLQHPRRKATVPCSFPKLKKRYHSVTSIMEELVDLDLEGKGDKGPDVAHLFLARVIQMAKD